MTNVEPYLGQHYWYLALGELIYLEIIIKIICKKQYKKQMWNPLIILFPVGFLSPHCCRFFFQEAPASFFSPSFASHSWELSLAYKGWYRWASGVVQERTKCLWMAWSAAWWQGGYSVRCYIQQHRPWVSNVRIYRGESGGSKSPSHYLLLWQALGTTELPTFLNSFGEFLQKCSPLLSNILH